MDDKIRLLEEERDSLLSNTDDIRVNKYSTSHSRIKGLYNRRITMLKKYGVEYPLQSREIRRKIIDTNIEKYGSKSILGNKEFREKYEIDTNFQKIDVKRKSRWTSINKYRVSHPQKHPYIKLKIRKTKMARYGTPNGRVKKDK